MAYKLDISLVQPNHVQEANAVPKGTTTAAQVNEALAAHPEHIVVTIEIATEAQIRGLLQYAKLIDNEATTTSVESAITALW